MKLLLKSEEKGKGATRGKAREEGVTKWERKIGKRRGSGKQGKTG